MTKYSVIYCKRSDTAYLLQEFAYSYAATFSSKLYDKGYSDGLEYALNLLGEGVAVISVKSLVDIVYNINSDSIIADITVCYNVAEDRNFLKFKIV